MYSDTVFLHFKCVYNDSFIANDTTVLDCDEQSKRNSKSLVIKDSAPTPILSNEVSLTNKMHHMIIMRKEVSKWVNDCLCRQRLS